MATDAKGNTTTTTYDADNRATETKVQDSSNTVVQDTTTAYDAVGNTVTSQVFDKTGTLLTTTTYTYDAANRLLAQTDPPADPGASDQSGQSNVTTYTYDTNGNTTETLVTNAAPIGPGTVTDTKATFDALGRQLTKTQDADTGSPKTTSYVYNAAGQQTSMTDEASNTTTSSYDALGRVTSVTNPDSTIDTTIYDAAGEQLTQSNSAGTTIDSYDPLGRVSTEQRKNGSGVSQGIVAYTYDANGSVLQKVTTLADGSQVTSVSTYDALDRQATMNDGTRSYTYDLAGNVTHMQVVVSGSGYAVQTDSTYDGGNRVSSLYDKVGPSATILHSYGYTYDGNGNRSSIVEDGATTTNYSYDDLNQLTQVKVGSTTTATYTYDANHNRTSLVTAAGTTGYTYDDSDHLTQKTDPDGKVTNYGYDTSGNLTSASYDPTGVNQVTQYHYDTNSRLTEIDQPSGTTIQFGYDTDNNRTTKTITSGGVSHSVNDVYVLGHLAYETDENGTVLATFTYDSSGVPVSVQVGSDPNASPRYYYVYNGHGDVVALVDAQGNVAASYAYDAFGQLTTASESFGSGTIWTNPYRYDGRDSVRYDGETDLYWMSVRAYDPTLDRFLSRDPLGRAPLYFSDQPYVYAGNNPLVNVDPSGQRFTTDSGQVRAAGSASSPSRVTTYPGRPLAGGKGKERASGKEENIWYWKEDGGGRHTAWMGPIEPDPKGWHFNLHIENKKGETLANYHFYFFGWLGMGSGHEAFVWYVIDTDGKTTRFKQSFEVENSVLGLAATKVAVDMTRMIASRFSLPMEFREKLMGEDENVYSRIFEEVFGKSNYLQDMLSRLNQRPLTKKEKFGL